MMPKCIDNHTFIKHFLIEVLAASTHTNQAHALAEIKITSIRCQGTGAINQEFRMSSRFYIPFSSRETYSRVIDSLEAHKSEPLLAMIRQAVAEAPFLKPTRRFPFDREDVEQTQAPIAESGSNARRNCR